MAVRRMISLRVVDTDAFMDMPLSTQALYLHLLVRADDDGFIANPKKIVRMIGSQDDDLKLLIGKRFILPFDSGVCVIKHWRIHNLIRSDRYTETQWIKEKQQLLIDEKTNKYKLLESGIQDVIPNGNQMEPQVRLGKVSIGKDSIEKEAYGESGLVKLTTEEYEKLEQLLGNQNLEMLIGELEDYIGSKGKKYQSHYHTLRSWARRKIQDKLENKNKKRIVKL